MPIFSRLDLMSAASDPIPLLPLAIVPKRYHDDRGWFSETFHDNVCATLALPALRSGKSIKLKAGGTVRGLHFQRPPAAQAKLVSVLRGRILDVAVDIRRGSPTFGRYVSIELSAEAGNSFTFRLVLPTAFVSPRRRCSGGCTRCPTITRRPRKAEFAGMTRTLPFHGHLRTRTLLRQKGWTTSVPQRLRKSVSL